MIRFGMHSSLWTADWTREAAEALIPEAKRYGIDLIEIALLTPEAIDVDYTRALLKEYDITPSGSLCLPMEATAPLDPGAAEAFLMNALEVAHALGCGILGGVTYSTLGW